MNYKIYFKQLISDMRHTCSFWVGIRRISWNLCPSCNSDAPAIDNCETCHNDRKRIKDRIKLLLGFIYSYSTLKRSGFRRYK